MGMQHTLYHATALRTASQASLQMQDTRWNHFTKEYPLFIIAPICTAHLDSQNTTIIDVYSLFVDGDRVKKDFYLDGLHLNEKGYEVLSQQLQCYL